MDEEFDRIINDNVEPIDTNTLAEGLGIINESAMHIAYILSHQLERGSIEISNEFAFLFSEYIQIADSLLTSILECTCEDCQDEEFDEEE